MQSPQLAPITLLQTSIGLGLYSANLIGLIPWHSIAFHPALIWPNPFRIPLSFLLVSTSLNPLPILQHSIGLLLWQAPLEIAFSSPTSPDPPEQSSYKIPPFAKAQLVASLTILAVELFFYYPSSEWITPYSLFPPLSYAMRWLWAATSTSSINVLGVPLNPIYSPILMCAVGGFREGDALVKGLVAAGAVSWVMGVKRGDGAYVVDWLWELGSWWFDIAKRFCGDPKGFSVTKEFMRSNETTGSGKEGEEGGAMSFEVVGGLMTSAAQFAASSGLFSMVNGGLGGAGGTPSLSLG